MSEFQKLLNSASSRFIIEGNQMNNDLTIGLEDDFEFDKAEAKQAIILNAINIHNKIHNIVDIKTSIAIYKLNQRF